MSGAGDEKAEGQGPWEPRISRPLRFLFRHYTGWMLRRQFASLCVSSASASVEGEAGEPLLVYLNHASWWDPVICLHLAEALFPGREQYGVIEARELERYGFFRRLGMLGVDRGSAGSVRGFLRGARWVLGKRGATLWMTPQGRFCDARERPVRFERGLEELWRVSGVQAVPLAIEYAFWNERLPSVFARFGKPLRWADLDRKTAPCEGDGGPLERALEREQDMLGAEVRMRDLGRFEVVLRGGGGVDFFYDCWKKLTGDPEAARGGEGRDS